MINTNVHSIPAINFLGRFKTQLLLEAKRHYIIQSGCVLLLVIFGLVVLGLYTYQAYLTFQLTRVTTAVEQETAIIEQLASFERRYLSLKAKTASIQVVSKNTHRHQQLVEDILALLPAGMIVKDVEIRSDGTLVFSASTTRPEMMQQFIENLEGKNPAYADSVARAVVTTAGIDLLGVYTFAVEVQLNS